MNSKAKVSVATVGATCLAAAAAAVTGEWVLSAACMAGAGMVVVEYLGFAGHHES